MGRHRALRLTTAIAAVLAITTTPGLTLAQDQIRVGQTVRGDLSEGDSRLDSGEAADAFVFQGRSGQRVTARLTSSAFDAYLMLRGPSGFTHDNDDAESGDTNALLDVRLPADGQYRLTATSYQPGERGAYSLTLNDGSGPASASSGGGGGALAPGQTARGALETSDTQISTGEYIDGWTLEGRRGETYDVRLSSGAFDSYLMVRGPGDLNQDNDDDTASRGSRDSRITFTAVQDGPITIAATSYQPGETGAYTISVADGSGASTSNASASTEGALSPGQTISGRLAEGAPQLRSGEYMNAWTLQGQRGQTLELRLASGDFDSYLFITGPGEYGEFNDDDPSGSTTDSRLQVTLPADGAYQVVATSYAPGESGAYRLTVGEGAGVQTASTPVASGSNLSIGQSTQGRLAGGDAALESGEFVDRFGFTGRRGQRVSVAARSSDFDTYLLLTTPGGEQIDNDDGGDGSTNSRIDLTLPEDGTYRLGVTSYAPGETGAYALSIDGASAAPSGVQVASGARVFAVMVGIADYGGDGDLPYTDEDALKLAETLRREGVLNPASVTLTNADATVAGVRNAFRQVAAQAGPDDIFLFFFSGHGSQRQLAGGASGTELDGRTETIVMRDGQITDAEMAELFGSLNTRLSMLVLDSCFSGGFAKNVVNRPGVMGLFSSEEDLTSQVAGKFQAGGYLAHFLRTGLSGEADTDGDDEVTAGELSGYLHAQFAREVQNVSAQTMDGQRNYQHLVVDRGGVQVDDVVIRLTGGGGNFGRP